MSDNPNSTVVDNDDLRKALDGLAQTIITEMGIRFTETNARLDRIDTTLTLYGKQLSAGARSIAGITQWIDTTENDYRNVLADLAELKIRVFNLESKK